MLVRCRMIVVAVLIFSSWAAKIASGQAPGMAPLNREDAVVDAASGVLNEIMAIPAQSIPSGLLAKAEGVAIIPDLLKGGFIVGVRHGRGVIVTRDEANRWRAPMFVQMTGASVGWQAGVQGTDLVLVFRTKNSIQNLLRGKFTIGANVSAAAGPVGRDAEAATDVSFKSEIFSYSRSRGLFAGVALDGAVLSVDTPSTNAYYRPAGGSLGPANQPLPASAGRLLATLAKYTGAAAPATAASLATPASADPLALRRQLVSSWQQLAMILDASWRTYLALPAEVETGGSLPSAESLRRTLDRFHKVAVDPRYQTLAQRKEFQSTLSLLREFSAAVAPAAAQSLTLPPPPQ